MNFYFKIQLYCTALLQLWRVNHSALPHISRLSCNCVIGYVTRSQLQTYFYSAQQQTTGILQISLGIPTRYTTPGMSVCPPICVSAHPSVCLSSYCQRAYISLLGIFHNLVDEDPVDNAYMLCITWYTQHNFAGLVPANANMYMTCLAVHRSP